MNMNGFYDKIDGFFAVKDFAAAENYMKESLAQADYEGDLAATVTVCNELGGFYRAFSRYNEGIPLYEKALGCIDALGMSGTEGHGTTLLNFATTLAIVGHYDDALDAYTKAAAVFEGPAYAKDFRLATLYNNMSSLYQSENRLTDAAEYLHKAMAILKNLKESEIEIAITWSNLAGVYLAMGTDRLADAKDAAQKAIELFNQVSGDSDVHYAPAVSALGEVFYLEGDFKAAETQFRKSMKLTKRDYGDQTLGYAVLCTNLAAALKAQDRLDEAAEYLSKASTIKERIGN
ncbi:MAG: tetratricopeptide repeat protein [Firmicutes bacterium]|nr:tetratricopeptide repeat protein [Bacillota bacterium]